MPGRQGSWGQTGWQRAGRSAGTGAAPGIPGTGAQGCVSTHRVNPIAWQGAQGCAPATRGSAGPLQRPWSCPHGQRHLARLKPEDPSQQHRSGERGAMALRLHRGRQVGKTLAGQPASCG